MKIRKIKGMDSELDAFLASAGASFRDYEARVAKIGRQVEQGGNQAIFEVTAAFDGAEISLDNPRQ